jgi:hypothetical protein
MSQREITRLQAMQRLESGHLKQHDVAVQLGLTTRQVKRLWRAYRREDADGLVSKRRGKPGNHRTNPALLQQALELIATRYPDFGPTLASEKLAERDGITIPKETLRTAMITARLWKPRRSKRKATHPPRERRPCFGELVQIDGSHHRWFEDRAPKCTLLVFVDDATHESERRSYLSQDHATSGFPGFGIASYFSSGPARQINEFNLETCQRRFRHQFPVASSLGAIRNCVRCRPRLEACSLARVAPSS